jgi:hypothetical protein
LASPTFGFHVIFTIGVGLLMDYDTFSGFHAVRR